MLSNKLKTSNEHSTSLIDLRDVNLPMYNQPFNEINKQDFLANYWQKRPCLFKNAFTAFPHYLSADELAGLALEDDIESRLIQYHESNAHWSMQQGPFEPEDFSSLPDSNWTLLVQSVDSWVSQTQELLKQFWFIPKWRFDDLMVSYATDQGGVGPHFDHFDVFLIQGQGKRHWRVGEFGKAEYQTEVATGLMQMEHFDAAIDLELTPGDMLYIPPKTAHWGVSIGESIGYSVGYRSPETRQVITLLAEYLQESDQIGEFFTDKYRNSSDHHNQCENQLVSWAQDQLQQLSQRPDILQEILCRQLSHSKLGLLTDNNIVDIQSVSEKSLIQLDSQLSVIWHTEKDQIVVYIEGEKFIFKKYLMTAIEKLANFEACPIKLFKKPPNTVDFPDDLSNLVNRGYVKLVN